MEAMTSDPLPLAGALAILPLRRAAARRPIFVKDPLFFASALARKLYDSNLRFPPKKRFRGFQAVPLQSVPAEKRKYTKKPLTKELVKEERPLPAAMAEKIRRMGGGRVQLVMQKQLQEADITIRKARLSIPSGKLKTDAEFLSESEREILSQDKAGTKSRRGIEVVVIDHRLEEQKLRLKMWTMTNYFLYNLTGKWNGLVRKNALEAGDTVQLWAFRAENRGRADSELCFALVKLEQVNNGANAAVSQRRFLE